MNRNILAWVAIVFLTLAAYSFLETNANLNNYNAYPFSEFLSKVDQNQVVNVTIRGRDIEGRFTDGTYFSTYAPDYPNLVDRLSAHGVRVEAKPLENKANSFIGILLSWFPILLLIGVWIFFMRQMQSGGGKAMGFGRSKARLMTEKHGRVTFKDVAGIDEAKEELTEIVDFLKAPQKFQNLGGKIPRGCLLVGSPGTGKTLLARAIAGEANVPFFSISGSDFVEMFVGVGASRVRDMFQQAKKHAPCIIFIDEIDAVGRHRGIGLGGGNDEREQTLNQLLVEMDGFESNEGIVLIAATNRPDVLDPALLRPGRFDRQIVVPIPDIKGREQILSVHMKKIKLAPDVDSHIIARGTPGLSGADLANLVNEAALLAARQDKLFVTMQDFEQAKDKILMGVERRSLAMTEDEKKLAAYHEGGHALVGYFLPASDPIHKATIIPRGRALGMVMRLPTSDRFSVTREKMKADLAVAMGGRVAEEIIFGYDKVTSGASSDIQAATRMARAMVTEWGLSDKVGPLNYSSDERNAYLGGGRSRGDCSEETSKLIDSEVKKLVEEGHKTAHTLITKHINKLHDLAKALIEFETLSGEEIDQIFKGKKLKRAEDKDEEGKASRGKSKGNIPKVNPEDQK